ncbi:MAG: triose-phosphate isomerase [Candidatus Neomarinimicrobiota bacterium]|nr:triose-phosphate isomerase [Candidatus Neomarinimicrobiota bacterium]
MIKKPIVAANWKMYKTPQEGVDFISELSNLLLDKEKPTIIFCPPFTSFFHMNEMISDLDMSLGAQNVYFEKEGAFTGEISVNMLKSCSVQYVIIGHSERRHIFNESNKDTNRKIHTVLDNEIIPIFCVGEKLDDRESNNTRTILLEQLEKGLAGVNIDALDRIIIAYEPVWAIGTGVNALPNQVQESHKMIRDILMELYDNNLNIDIPILYGGSVKPDNSEELINTKGVDGFLIGGASLNLDTFSKIIEIVHSKFMR